MIETMCAPVEYRRLRKEQRKVATDNFLQSTYGVVLAGGRGSRLKQLTDWRAKPAVPFAGKLKIIDFTLSNCVNSGIPRTSVLTQYKAQSLTRHIKRVWAFLNEGLCELVNVVPPRQLGTKSGYSGTADAVYQNLEMLRQADAQYVLVLAGDHVYKMDYNRIIAEHVQRKAEVTVACTEVPLEQASSFGVVSVDDGGHIRAFEEKPAFPCAMPDRPGVALASMGIYVFNADFLCRELERDAADLNSCHDFGRDIIPRVISHARVFAHDFFNSCVNMVNSQPYWRDVGTLDAYWEANMDLLRALPELDLYDDTWPIHNLQSQLIPTEFMFDGEGGRHIGADSLSSSDSVVSGATMRRSMLFSNARVGHGSVIEDSLLLPGVVVGRNVVLHRTIIDSHCVLPDGINIGVDPDADSSRFTVTEKGVTLVTPAMLGQAVHAEG